MLVLIAAWLVAARPQAVDVFVSGQEYPSVRIPALVRTGGTLLALAEGRQRNADHAGNDIVLKRSEDDGRTWSALQVVLAEEGPASFNNPLAVVLPSGPHEGRVLLMVQRSTCSAAP